MSRTCTPLSCALADAMVVGESENTSRLLGAVLEVLGASLDLRTEQSFGPTGAQLRLNLGPAEHNRGPTEHNLSQWITIEANQSTIEV
jgi:hypothetical protein